MAEAVAKKQITEIVLTLSLEEANDLLDLMGPIKAVGTSYEVFSALFDVVRGK